MLAIAAMLTWSATPASAASSTFNGASVTCDAVWRHIGYINITYTANVRVFNSPSTTPDSAIYATLRNGATGAQLPAKGPVNEGTSSSAWTSVKAANYQVWIRRNGSQDCNGGSSGLGSFAWYGTWTW